MSCGRWWGEKLCHGRNQCPIAALLIKEDRASLISGISGSRHLSSTPGDRTSIAGWGQVRGQRRIKSARGTRHLSGSGVSSLRLPLPYDAQVTDVGDRGKRPDRGAVAALELWALVRKSWPVLLACALIGILAGAAYAWTQPRLYAATTTAYVIAGTSETVGDAFAGSSLATQKAETYLLLVESRSVAERVAEELGLSSTAPVSGALTGSTENGVIFRITARAGTPELAAQMADAAVRATSVEANALETLDFDGEPSGQTVVRIHPVELAQTPTQPVSPNWVRNMLTGLGAGVLAGIGVMLLRHSTDRRVRQLSDAEEASGASGLGIIPKATEVVDNVFLTRDMGGAAEALRQLRTNLRFVSVDDPVRSIVITSANASEGKSTTAAHLAAMLADAGQPTVLIDADLRRPVQAQHFGVDGLVGLTEVLAGSVGLETVLVSTGQPGLWLLPAGRIPPNPSELLGSERMKDLIAELSRENVVIIDAPPLLPVTDAALLTVAADGALVIVKSGHTRVEHLELAAKKISQVDGRLLGVVLSMVAKKDLGSATFGYGYGSYAPQDYYSENRKRQRRGSRRRRGERRTKREQRGTPGASDDYHRNYGRPAETQTFTEGEHAGRAH